MNNILVRIKKFIYNPIKIIINLSQNNNSGEMHVKYFNKFIRIKPFNDFKIIGSTLKFNKTVIPCQVQINYESCNR